MRNENLTHAPFSPVVVDGRATREAAREVENRIMKGLLDLVVLEFLKGGPMHGYQVITRIRKTFNLYYGPSTIYPLLGAMQKKGYVTSQWNTDTERPRKVYTITRQGESLLTLGEESLKSVRMKLGLQ